MSKKDDLFILIKSLDKQEKRFFKLYAKLHNQNKTPHYVYLFDILDRMEMFDKEQMSQELHEKLPNKRVASLKSYLKQNILNALKAFHKKNTWSLQETEDMGIVKVLLSKNLFQLAEKILLKMRKKVRQQENFQLHIQVNSQLIFIKNRTKHNNVDEIKLIQQYFDECLLCTDQLKEVIWLLSILGKVTRLVYSRQRLSKKFQKNLKEILKEVQQIQPTKIKSKRANYLYHNLLYVIHRDLHNVSEYTQLIKKLQKIVDDSFFLQYPNRIVATYLNLLVTYIDNKEVKNFYPTLQKSKLLLEQFPHLQTRYQHWLLIRELELCAFIHQTEPSSILALSVQNYLDSQFDMTNKNELLIALARCYFVIQQYERSLDILLNVTLYHRGLLDEMFYIETNLLEIFCYYELNSHKISNQKMKIFQRKIKQSIIENSILHDLLKKIFQVIKTPKTDTKLIQQLKKMIEIDNANQGYHKNLYFLSVWTQNKIL